MKPLDFKNHLAHLGWSQNEFAERIGVHPNTVSKWMTGKAEMPGPASAYLLLAKGVRLLLL